MANHKKQFCPRGHDTLIVGRLGGGCMSCRRDASRRRTREHPELTRAAVKRWADAHKDWKKDKVYRQTYGITLEDYKRLYIEQNGICPICSKYFTILVVDHDHVTGKFRGLICKTCNRAIGLLKDDPFRLRAAVEYLEARAEVA